MAGRGKVSGPAGLAQLRRPGTVTELLFVYECLVRPASQLKPIASALGLTVQAASHVFRQLRSAGFVEVRDGRYRPTVDGVARLQGLLGSVRDDVGDPWAHLSVIRTCRAVAREDLPSGAAVSFELREGRLTAGPGPGPARGRTLSSARRGELVEAGDLEGIDPVVPGRVSLMTFPDTGRDSADLVEALRARLPEDGASLVGAFGLEAEHLLARAGRGPVERFGLAAATTEAARLGLDSLVLVRDQDVPRLLAQFEGLSPPALTVAPLRGGRRATRRR